MSSNSCAVFQSCCDQTSEPDDTLSDSNALITFPTTNLLERWFNYANIVLQTYIYFHLILLLWAEMEWVLWFLFSLNSHICSVAPAAASFLYHLRTTLMFYLCILQVNVQSLSYDRTTDLSTLFTSSPQVCSIWLRSGLWGPSQTINVPVVFSVADSSINSWFG